MTRPKRKLLIVTLTLVVAYLAICLAAYLMQRSLIYHPNNHIAATPKAVGLEFNEFQLQSSDGVTFTVWRIPHLSSGAVVVYFHGNADNISMNIDLYRTWYNLGVSVIAFEYRGYLGSIGEPTEQGIERDLNILADSLHNWYPPGTTKFIAMGRSLGGAVAAKLASLFPVDGLILESTFSSMADVGGSQFPFLPVSILLTERYETEQLVHKLSIPVLVIHSASDEVVPFHLGRKLYNAANDPKQFVELIGGHNTGIDVSRDLLESTYRDFLNRVISRE